MTIGQVAKAAGLGVETIRFYEKEGLIDEPLRRTSGYRDYAQSAVPRLMFIRRAKELGFTLAEIRELLALRVERRASCSTVKARAEKKIADIDGRIRALRRMKRALVALSASCDAGSPSTSECPVLDALESRTR